ncbi:MAG: replicative DNA helicase [Alphaproteobacteria bacterium]|nr:MAG: replicative DNA helicase [Alphaproteobacteria bacterium]
MGELGVIPERAAESQAGEGPGLPHNVEAEQALLGAILLDNDAYARVEEILGPEHFFDPVHARIFEALRHRISRGLLATPETLKPYFEDDPGLAELGGVRYLVKLAAAATSAYAAPDYARMIRDLATRRELIAIGEEIAERAATFELDDDPEAQITEAEQKLYRLAEQGRSATGFRSFLAAVTEAVKVAEAAHKREGGLAGLSTGLKDLDEKLGGLHRSDLLIIAGRPSMGKTALATNIAFSIARARAAHQRGERGRFRDEGGVVGFFSLEMSAEQLAARILSEASEIPSERIRRGDMDEAEFLRFLEVAKDLESAPLFIDDTPALPISQLAARARRLKRTHGLDVLFVDYLQLVRPASGRSDGRVQEVSEITQGLKAIAKELDIPVVALSQLSRQVEQRDDKRPQLADLRESGSIEQDADVVMFVFREEYYKERLKPSEHDAEAFAKWQAEMEKVHGLAEVIIGKQRHGPIGTVRLAFDGRFTRFSDLAREWHAEGGVGFD